jgi:RNA polymerase sigma factor (sigma-70 family)
VQVRGEDREDLIRRAEPVARRVARRMRRLFEGKIEAEEIDALARLALVEALHSYDGGRAGWEDYVGISVRWAVLSSIRSESHGRAIAARARIFLSVDHIIEEHAARQGDTPLLTYEEQEASLQDLLEAEVGAMAVGILAAGAEIGITSVVATPEEQLARAELQRILAHAIAALDERERTLVERYFFGDETITAIAGGIGLSKSRAGKVLEGAVQTLRAALMNTR